MTCTQLRNLYFLSLIHIYAGMEKLDPEKKTPFSCWIHHIVSKAWRLNLNSELCEQNAKLFSKTCFTTSTSSKIFNFNVISRHRVSNHPCRRFSVTWRSSDSIVGQSYTAYLSKNQNCLLSIWGSSYLELRINFLIFKL